MTIEIELTPEEEARLREAAQRHGIEPAECIRRLLAEHLPALSPGAQATRDLLRAWREEDETADPDALRQAEAELTEFKQAMNAPRAAAGARLLYP
jgi:glycine/D-amino acid oxidase-like deaminating enzyme